jgi:lysozyme
VANHAALVLEKAKYLIKKYEGLHKVKQDGLVYPYLCPAGYWTQGYGLLVEDGSAPPITVEVADARLSERLVYYVLAALRLSPVLAGHPSKLAAITSFIFNLGEGRYKSSSLRRLINDGRWEEAAQQFPKWVWGGGKKLPGLIRRRAEERAVFMED